MLNIVLYQPEIPPNTGNVMRLCANVGARLHLVHPLGFFMDEHALKRAGMDYRDQAVVIEHQDFAACHSALSAQRWFAFTTKAKTVYTDARFQDEDVLLFGPETRGLPDELLNSFPEGQKLKLPMQPDSRSLNLSNTVAVGVYEAWRQLLWA